MCIPWYRLGFYFVFYHPGVGGFSVFVLFEYLLPFGNVFSLEVDYVVHKIGSTVSIADVDAVHYICFIFALDRFAVAYANSFSEFATPILGRLKPFSAILGPSVSRKYNSSLLVYFSVLGFRLAALS